MATPLSTPGATGAGTEPDSHQLISLKLFFAPTYSTFTNLMYFTVTTVMGLAVFLLPFSASIGRHHAEILH